MHSHTFITYAHRGASHYCPENTMLSFCEGVRMGANGIETDVRRTRDGVLVLFHDRTLARTTGVQGEIADYTYGELQDLAVKKGDLADKIPTLEEFLSHFSRMDITLAIELKADGIEKEVIELIRKYGAEQKSIVTAFELERIQKARAMAPWLRVGYLAKEINDTLIESLLAIGAYEICPNGCDVTPENVDSWHRMGLNVRAWGISDEEIMKRVYDAGADGMTVNFPDVLLDYIKQKCN